MKEIKLTRGYVTIIDDEYFDELNKFNWYEANGYAVTHKGSGENRRVVFMHNMILWSPRGLEIDHVDGNTLNNRRSNLRIVTHKENMRNQKVKLHSSKYKGVHWDSDRNKWKATTKINGKVVCIGRFLTEIEAAKAYNDFVSHVDREHYKLNTL